MPTPSAGYRNAEGKRLPSVTTILGRFKDSGALIKWAYREGRAHAELEAAGKPAPRDLYDKGSTSTKAAEAGTIAHNIIEAKILGRPSPYGAQGEGEQIIDRETFDRALNAVAQYEQWAKQTRMTVTHTEMGLVSEKHQFGGTLDAVGEIDGKIVLLDWKTSNAVYGDYILQLAAYALLLEENRPELTPTGFHILRFSKDNADFAHHSYGNLDNEKEAFILMARLYPLVQKTAKR